MIAQIALLPDSFEESNNSNMLIATLKDILNNGIFIVDFRTGNWSRIIQTTYINEYMAPSLRDKVLTLIRQLKDRKKIVKVTNYEHQISNENDWLTIAKLHSETENLNLVVSGERLNPVCQSTIGEICHCINDVLISDEWVEVKKEIWFLQKHLEILMLY